jgi:RNA polymerase primary sigma factor
MASKAANTAEVTEIREEAAEAPLLDSLAAGIKKMLARGSGYLLQTASAALPRCGVSEQTDTMTMLSELGITVIENEESEEPAVRQRRGRQ